MKTKCIILHRSALAALITCLLSASSLTTMAQTYNGQLKLADASDQIEANVYPLSNRPATIKVIFNNRTSGAVRVVIRDGKGKIHYDAYESIALYRRNFDLSGLPVGDYTVELSKRNEKVARIFAINPPATNWITMEMPAKQDTPDQPNFKGKRLTSNQ
ncbi:hypothetical protein [Spirosoma spitsbergense]|uniref:hypothetical protein n=1 Tax=Spirosoma spitsbergense TaxID=431554 RepID=UPI000369ADC1|nr:hypothetical protein [Spirosoma spitsbergense]